MQIETQYTIRGDDNKTYLITKYKDGSMSQIVLSPEQAMSLLSLQITKNGV